MCHSYWLLKFLCHGGSGGNGRWSQKRLWYFCLYYIPFSSLTPIYDSPFQHQIHRHHQRFLPAFHTSTRLIRFIIMYINVIRMEKQKIISQA